MDTRRIVLYSLFAFILFYLYNAWQKDYPALPAPTQQASLVQQSGALPTESSVEQAATRPTAPSLPVAPVAFQKPIEVITDVLHLKIDAAKGEVIAAGLLHYPEDLSQSAPYALLTDDAMHRYTAGSSLVSVRQQQLVAHPFHFQAASPVYHLAPHQKTLVVTLTGENDEGLKVTKTFTLTRGSYVIEEHYTILNQGAQPQSVRLMTQLTRQAPPASSSSMFQIGTYTGASYSAPGEHRYQKVSFDDMAKKNLNTQATGGWVAMQQHYFLTAWIPDTRHKHVFYTQANVQDETYTIGTIGEVMQVPPQQDKEATIRLYVGPELTQTLNQISPGLGLTVDYGWFWFISDILFAVMKYIHGFVGNWGWSIILITVLIKLVFYRFSASSYRSMAGMRNIQPKLQALRERYGDDKTKLSQATMELYRQEKINPLGGCLPIVIQIPVFIALYWVLVESVELRQAPFLGWMNDLAVPDMYHVLPIIMGATMLIQQRLNPTPPDPVQAKMMMFLPLLFIGLFWNFPSGLVLYWIVNNLLSILQQWWITRQV